MPEIKHQISGTSPEVSSAEIHIPDDSDWGTGTFRTVFKPSAFTADKTIVSSMVNAPRFQITATLNPNGRIPVAIGRMDNSDPVHRATFALPDVIAKDKPHILIVSFARWYVLSATLDGISLNEERQRRAH